ncbi:MAG: hypothetical protein M3R34_08160 [Acidobacteriota bacterium]|nr:hypothetical protein [Acidobacteriota bacterium]
MRRTRGIRGAASFGCIVWLVLLAVVGYALYKIVPVKVASSAFADFLQEESSFGSIKSVQQIQAEILAKAKEMSIPVNKDNLIIKKTRESITIEAHYEMTIDFFNGAYKYVWKFDPVYTRPIFLV